MKGDFDVDFPQIAARHAGEALYLKKLILMGSIRSNDVVDPSLARALDREKASRARVIAWEPCSIDEAQSKLLYIIQYLIVMRTSLDDREMDAIVRSISHLRRDYQLSSGSGRLPRAMRQGS